MRYFIHFVIGLLLIQAPFAESIEVSDFETTKQESRYTELIENIRCPVCQGQSIGGSNSDLAKDLRGKVREMILDNQSDSEIYSFMVERYGEFVVYKPPVSPKDLSIMVCTSYSFASLFNLLVSINSTKELIKKPSVIVTLKKPKNC